MKRARQKRNTANQKPSPKFGWKRYKKGTSGQPAKLQNENISTNIISFHFKISANTYYLPFNKKNEYLLYFQIHLL